ncbi:MAG: RHS repeat-associated core domain-containing protein, partial [Candidatus Scalindua sp.]
YDPDLGRFISEDPLWGNIRDPQSLNRFRYARNNPFRLTDRTGLYDDQDNDWDTEMFGNSPDSPTRSEDGEGMGLDFPELLGPARDAEHGNPIPFIEAVKQLIEKYLGKRKPEDKYSYLPIARNWDDIPKSVRDYKTGDHWKDYASKKGNHPMNKRFEGGYHIHTEVDEQGVFSHYDAYDSFTEYGALLHYIEEVLGFSRHQQFISLP